MIKGNKFGKKGWLAAFVLGLCFWSVIPMKGDRVEAGLFDTDFNTSLDFNPYFYELNKDYPEMSYWPEIDNGAEHIYLSGEKYSLDIDLTKHVGNAGKEEIRRCAEVFWYAYPKMYERFDTEEYPLPTYVNLRIVHDYENVADTCYNDIGVNEEWIADNPYDVDCLTHELGHVVQCGWDSDYVPGGADEWWGDFSERFADILRYEYSLRQGYYNDVSWLLYPVDEEYSYERLFDGDMLRFWIWLDETYTTRDVDILRRLDGFVKDLKYTSNEWNTTRKPWDALFKGTDADGKTLEELYNIFVSDSFATLDASVEELGETSELMAYSPYLRDKYTIGFLKDDGLNGFVNRCYRIAFQREPDLGGFIYWKKRLMNHEITGSVLVYDFLFSKEYIALRTDDEQFVTDLYAMFMGREPDKEGFDFWCDQLKRKASRNMVFTGFANSEEFYNLCFENDITAGYFTDEIDINKLNLINLFVERIYRCCFNRIGDRKGQSFWTRCLINGSVNGVSIINKYIHSLEYMNKRNSDPKYLKSLYVLFMGRDFDEEGYYFWLTEMAKGKSRDRVFGEFAESKEFTSICEKYGISKGSYEPEKINKQEDVTIEFNPHVSSDKIRVLYSKEQLDAVYNLIDALREGKDSFQCGSEETYRWCIESSILNVFYPVAMGMLSPEDEDGLVTYKDGMGKINYSVSKEDMLAIEKEFERRITDIVNRYVKPEYSDFEKCLALSRYFGEGYGYEYIWPEKTIGESGVYRAFMLNQGVCSNVAPIYTYLLLQCDVDAITVGCLEDFGHDWTFVTIDGKGYHMDGFWTYADFSYEFDENGEIREKSELHPEYLFMTEKERYRENGSLQYTRIEWPQYENVMDLPLDFSADDETYSYLRGAVMDRIDTDNNIIYLYYPDDRGNKTYKSYKYE
ncbi:MAG: DUF4214 domain-containing protein [Lachnospiraceae bacterium]|nr:DUF4214 domain-containing protein [Lachnospiraceae bacterium]